MAISPDDLGIYVAGRQSQSIFTTNAGNDQLFVGRLSADGAADDTFGNGGIALRDLGTSEETASGLAVDSESRPIVAVGAPTFSAHCATALDGATTLSARGLASIGGSGDSGDVLIDEGGSIVAGGTRGRVRRRSRGSTGTVRSTPISAATASPATFRSHPRRR